MKRAAFTLVELLVSIAIIGVLIALLLPAVQAAREAGRRSACVNNIRQSATALLHFHDASGSFPPGGWGHHWVACRDRGTGQAQPGGWIYLSLPYLEQGHLAKLAALSSGEPDAQLLERPLATFNCPSRRPLQAWPISDRYPYMTALKPAGNAENVGRGDYAINGGATKTQSFNGPQSLAAGDMPTYSWPSASGIPGQPMTAFTGISHVRMSARLKSIEDGTSNTYLMGEKYLDPTHYANGESLGDNESLYSGYCTDNHRFTELDLPPQMDGAMPPNELRTHFQFGSAHVAGLNMGNCDGSVHFVGYDVDPEIHHLRGNVSDHGVVLRRN